MAHNKLGKILKEMVILDLTCLLKNLDTSQEATVRMGRGTMDWFQLGQEYVKAVYCHPAYLTYTQCCCRQLPVVSDSLWPRGLQLTRPPRPSPSPGVCPSSCSLHQWRHPAISSSDTLFSFYPQSFPASGTFPLSHLLVSDNQNPGASASVLPVHIQGWSPLKLTGLISLLSKGLSRVFSDTIVWGHQFFGILPSLQSSCYNCMWPLGWP